MTNHNPGTGSYPQPPYQQPITQPGWQPAGPMVPPARPRRRFLAHGLTAIVSLIIGGDRRGWRHGDLGLPAPHRHGDRDHAGRVGSCRNRDGHR